MAMLLNCLVLVVGFVLLVKGADFFVDGSSGVARRQASSAALGSKMERSSNRSRS